MMNGHLISFIGGLLALYVGAEWLVRGSSRLARAVGISPLVVGLTVVAFGTSAPELVVSTFAAFENQSDVAMGNVIGSNILNIGLILGLCALIQPIGVHVSLIRREIPMMIFAIVLVPLLGADGFLSRVDGLLLVIGFVAYMFIVVTLAKRQPATVQADYVEFEKARALEPGGESKALDIAMVIGGLAALVLGAHWLVEAAVTFARSIGMSELVVGLTIVAIGTSLPELATSAVAALRKESDIALGNVVGSNIFNVLLILGAAAVVRPISVNPTLMRVDIPVCIAASVLLVPFARSRARIDRWEGAVLLAGYLAFTAFLILA